MGIVVVYHNQSKDQVTHSEPEVIYRNGQSFLKRDKTLYTTICSYTVNIMASWIREGENCVVMCIANNELKKGDF